MKTIEQDIQAIPGGLSALEKVPIVVAFAAKLNAVTNATRRDALVDLLADAVELDPRVIRHEMEYGIRRPTRSGAAS